LLAVCGVFTATAQTGVVDGVAAYVNEEIITVGEVLQALEVVAGPYRQQYTGPTLQQKLQDAYEEILQSLIDRRLVVQAFERDPKVDHQRMERLVEMRVQELIRERFDGDRQRLLEALAKQHQSLEDVRRMQREQLIVQFMTSREVESRVLISPEEVRRAYAAAPEKYGVPERVRLRGIVIGGGADAEQQQARRRLAEDVHRQLLGGADFAELARKFSDDPRARTGGDWGWVEPRDLQPVLAQALNNLAPGGLTGVIAVRDDFYILKVEEREAARTRPFDEVRGEIEAALRRQESQRIYDGWIDRLRRKAYIHVVKSALP